jgi:hypothetical protein
MLALDDQWYDFTFEDEFLEALRKKPYREGVEGLMMAVLQDGIDCFQKYFAARNPKGKRLFQEAEDWILDENTDSPFSFENICDVVGFNPQFLRDGLMRWKETALREVQKGNNYRLFDRSCLLHEKRTPAMTNVPGPELKRRRHG